MRLGTAATANFSHHVAFVLRQDKVAILPGWQSRANYISDAGDIVGQTILPNSKFAGPVLWKKGSPIDSQHLLRRFGSKYDPARHDRG
jgi:hypothetical protein